ncbi:MAG: DUF4287 domain-containing protein [Inquilinaceae bacterium]
MALSPAEMDEAVLRNLAEKTGRDLDDWQRLLGSAGPFAKPAAAVNWLKGEHGLGHVTAQIIVRKLKEKGATPPDGDAVGAVLGSAGAGALRRILVDLVAHVPDLQVMPRKAYVGLGTPVQFAVAVRPKSGDTSRGPSIASALPCLGKIESAGNALLKQSFSTESAQAAHSSGCNELPLGVGPFGRNRTLRPAYEGVVALLQGNLSHSPPKRAVIPGNLRSR